MGPGFEKGLVFFIVIPGFIKVGPVFANINLVLVNEVPGFLVMGLGCTIGCTKCPLLFIELRYLFICSRWDLMYRIFNTIENMYHFRF